MSKYRGSRRLFLTLMACVLAVSVLAPSGQFSPAPALSQTTPDAERVAQHYRGKRLTLVSNHSAGGSTGAWLTLVARHIGRFIPGNPRVLLAYRPGAGGVVGSRYMVEVARPDGYTIGGLGGGMVRTQAIGEMPEDVDLRKLVIFGGVNEVSIAFGRREVFPNGVRSLAKREPTRRPIYMASLSKDDTAVRQYVWLKLVGYEPIKDFKHLAGWPGGMSEAYLAMQRGEVDFSDTRVGGFKTSVMPLVEEGGVVSLWQSGMFDDRGNVVRHPAFPKIPTYEQVYEEHVGKIVPSADWEFLDWRRATESPLRPLVAPTGTPQYLIDALIEAIRNMQQDPAYQRDQEKLYGSKDPVHVLGNAARKAVVQVIEGSEKARRFFEEQVKKF